MSAKIEMSGKRFGRLVVQEENGRARKEIAWLCLCDCGGTKTVSGWGLRRGLVKSCGCALKASQQTNKFKPRHGMADSRVHRSWMSMLDRCTRKTCSAYKNYGGRGIVVCERWQVFENFLADMGLPPQGFEIDRIDNEGNYEPNNCRWASTKQQSRNRRVNLIVEIDGVRKCVADWADQSGIKYHTIYRRLRVGVTAKEAVFGPVRNAA